MTVAHRNESFRFFYRVSDGKTLVIALDPASAARPGYPTLADRLEGSCEIIDLDEKSLWLKKETGCDQLNDPTRCERVNLKASR